MLSWNVSIRSELRWSVFFVSDANSYCCLGMSSRMATMGSSKSRMYPTAKGLDLAYRNDPAGDKNMLAEMSRASIDYLGCFLL